MQISGTHQEEHNANAINQIVHGPVGEMNSDCGLGATSWKTQHLAGPRNAVGSGDTEMGAQVPLRGRRGGGGAYGKGIMRRSF